MDLMVYVILKMWWFSPIWGLVRHRLLKVLKLQSPRCFTQDGSRLSYPSWIVINSRHTELCSSKSDLHLKKKLSTAAKLVLTECKGWELDFQNNGFRRWQELHWAVKASIDIALLKCRSQGTTTAWQAHPLHQSPSCCRALVQHAGNSTAAPLCLKKDKGLKKLIVNFPNPVTVFSAL